MDNESAQELGTRMLCRLRKASQGLQNVKSSSAEQGSKQRWLFTTQHKNLSSEEMETYERHTAAAEELDEDFFDNFS